MARSPRGVFPNGGLQGYLDTRRANLAKTSSFWIHGGDLLPLRGVISVRGPLENTWRRFIAMIRRCGMHCAPFDSRLARRRSARRQQGARRWRRGCGGRGGQRQWRRRPLEVTGCWVVPTLSAGSHRATRRCRYHLSETTLPGGVDVIRTKGGKAPFSENGLCVLNGWGGCGHLLLVLC